MAKKANKTGTTVPAKAVPKLKWPVDGVFAHRPTFELASDTFVYTGTKPVIVPSKAIRQEAFAESGFRMYDVKPPPDGLDTGFLDKIPKGIVLQDDLLHAIITDSSGLLKPKERGAKFPADFNSKGTILSTRRSRGRAAKETREDVIYYCSVNPKDSDSVMVLWGDEGEIAYPQASAKAMKELVLEPAISRTDPQPYQLLAQPRSITNRKSLQSKATKRQTHQDPVSASGPEDESSAQEGPSKPPKNAPRPKTAKPAKASKAAKKGASTATKVVNEPPIRDASPELSVSFNYKPINEYFSLTQKPKPVEAQVSNPVRFDESQASNQSLEVQPAQKPPPLPQLQIPVQPPSFNAINQDPLHSERSSFAPASGKGKERATFEEQTTVDSDGDQTMRESRYSPVRGFYQESWKKFVNPAVFEKDSSPFRSSLPRMDFDRPANYAPNMTLKDSSQVRSSLPRMDFDRPVNYAPNMTPKDSSPVRSPLPRMDSDRPVNYAPNMTPNATPKATPNPEMRLSVHSNMSATSGFKRSHPSSADLIRKTKRRRSPSFKEEVHTFVDAAARYLSYVSPRIVTAEGEKENGLFSTAYDRMINALDDESDTQV
ncbi:MAG: hypothetical protein Q9195_008303 [Heterodermia aff. obscurata]